MANINVTVSGGAAISAQVGENTLAAANSATAAAASEEAAAASAAEITANAYDIPSELMKSPSGATEVYSNGRYHAWSLAATGSSFLVFKFRVPTFLTSAKVQFVLANAASNSGNISLSFGILQCADGETTNASSASSAAYVGAIDATAWLQDTIEAAGTLTLTPGKECYVRLSRNGDSASDTLPNAVHLFGIRLVKP
jgi:hypothetical protein